LVLKRAEYPVFIGITATLHKDIS